MLVTHPVLLLNFIKVDTGSTSVLAGENQPITGQYFRYYSLAESQAAEHCTQLAEDHRQILSERVGQSQASIFSSTSRLSSDNRPQYLARVTVTRPTTTGPVLLNFLVLIFTYGESQYLLINCLSVGTRVLEIVPII